jgi:glycosyltransferase involved in cell wall biosynthesis
VARPDTLQLAEWPLDSQAQVATPVVAHVVHVIECLSEGTLTFLTRAMAELDDFGARQTLIISRRPDMPADIAALLPRNIRIVELPPAARSHLGYARELARVLHRYAAEPAPLAVHLHAAEIGLVGRCVLATLRGRAACFYTPHELPLLNPQRRVRRTLTWLTERLAGWLPLAPVGCGVAEARLLARVYGRPAFVLENPIDDAYFEVLHRETQPPAVISVGRTSDHNVPGNFAQLALRFAIDELPAQFMWVGSGDADREALLRAGGVLVTGRMTADRIASLLASAAIYVQTSVWEGVPLSVIRAMAVGLPCVVTDVAAHRDLIVHGKTGFIVRDLDDLERHVRWLLDEPELRQRLGAAARREVQARYARERFRSALRHLYGLGRAR